MSGFLFNSIKKSALTFGHKPALVFKNNSYTFSEVYIETLKCINYLKSIDLKKGDIIFNALGTSIEFVALTYAANYLGAIVCPISTKIKELGFSNYLHQITPVAIFYDSEKLGFIENLNSNKYLCVNNNELAYLYSKQNAQLLTNSKDEICNEEDPAIIMFTSGTTSLPKGAIITNHNIKAAILAYENALNLTDTDNTILAVPLCHITGLIAILALFIYLGGTIYCEKRFDAETTIKLVQKYKISFLHGSPTVFILLNQFVQNTINLEQQYNSLKSIACGAGRLNKGTIQTLKHLFPNSKIHTVYGLTESTSPFTIYTGDISNTEFCSSSGKPVKGAELKIVEEKTGKTLGTNQIGQIWIKGDMVIKSYFPMTIENKKLFKDGFLNTGDLGLINDQGCLEVKDRAKDIINRGGEKIFCPEIESLISLDKNILEVAVVAKQDAIYGEVPVAFVRLKDVDKFNSIILNNFLLKNLPKFNIPVEYYIISDFPRTENGKISKKDLRAKLKD